MSEMCKKRSRPKIIEKILSMGLASDRKELYKKRGKSGARSRRRRNQSDSESGDEGLYKTEIVFFLTCWSTLKRFNEYCLIYLH